MLRNSLMRRGLQRNLNGRRMQERVVDETGFYGPHNALFVVLILEPGHHHVNLKRPQPGGLIGGFLGRNSDPDSLGGETAGAQVLRGIEACASAQRGQKKLGRAHPGILAAIGDGLIAYDLVAANLRLEGRAADVINDKFHIDFSSIDAGKMQWVTVSPDANVCISSGELHA